MGRYWALALTAIALGGPSSAAAEDCSKATTDDARAQCGMTNLLGADKKALRIAREMYDRTGWLTSVEEPFVMNGGWRGKVQIVPHPPIHGQRRHLEWLSATTRELETFFAGIEKAAEKDLAFRWRNITLRFFRSVRRRTPSAYATNWSVAYNVSGSLLHSAPGVRNTMFHEIFHLNDETHDNWSFNALTALYERIISRCKRGNVMDDRCLSPYAPGHTKVKGSTYYAFHPGEGVEEYGAELAMRYFLDNRAVILGKKLRGTPYKCRNEINAQAWKMLVDEFFAGTDLLPPCKTQ